MIVIIDYYFWNILVYPTLSIHSDSYVHLDLLTLLTYDKIEMVMKPK